jgi:Flp pilus assembly protein CpaB
MPGVLISVLVMGATLCWPGSGQTYSAPSSRAEQYFQELLGRRLTSAMYVREPDVVLHFGGRGSGPSRYRTPKGRRVVTVPIAEITGARGFVLEGARVDLLLPGTTAFALAANLILKNVEVVSRAWGFESGGEAMPGALQSVSLLVTDEQAETIRLAGSGAAFRLVVRNPFDREEPLPPAHDLLNWDGIKLTNPISGWMPVKMQLAPYRRPAHVEAAMRAPAVQPIKEDHPFVMEIILGDGKHEIKFDSQGESK